MYSVYRIVNQVNRHCYVGFTTKTPEKRWERHKINARRGTQRYLYCAMRKYGSENFALEMLQQGDDEEWGLKAVEPLWVGICRPEYNQTLGGDGSLGCSPSMETREKQSQSQVGRVFSAEHRAKISHAKKGVKKTPEAIAKMIGRKHKSETIKKFMARQPTEETRAKISRSWLRRIVSEETRLKMSRSQVVRRAREKTLDSMG